MNIKYEVKPIEGYEGIYSVSNTGQVFSHNYLRTGQKREMKLKKDNEGYFLVGLYQDGKQKWHKVHRLVLEAFIPNPDNKLYCDHIDTNKANNHVSNLRWCTRKENMNNPLTLKKMSDAQKGKTIPKETRRKMSESRVGKTIYKFRNKKTNQEFIGTAYDFRNKYNLASGNVSNLVNGKLKHHKKWILV